MIRIAKAALVMTYLVIIAGAVVRMTGSGMGCPDWPKCFGQWVPPTEESQLPANYHEIYSQRGYADTTFNVFHTWTEYINRLIGALDGLVLLALLLYSLKYRQTDRNLVRFCLAIFVAIGFQGWLGKIVVDSVLAPVKITLHMLMALVLIAMIIALVAYLQRSTVRSRQSTAFPLYLKGWFILAIFLTLIQVALGTQVRQQIDAIATRLDYGGRETWINQLNAIFGIHRVFALIILLLNGYIFIRLRLAGIHSSQVLWVVLLLGLEIITGIIMAYFGIPSFIQPIHLVLASIIFELQFYVLVAGPTIYVRRSKEDIPKY